MIEGRSAPRAESAASRHASKLVAVLILTAAFAGVEAVVAFTSNSLVLAAGAWPRSAITCSSTRATRTPESEVSTSIASASRVYKSTTVSIRSVLPDQRASETKSSPHTSSDRLGLSSGVLATLTARFRFRLRTLSPSSR